MAYGILYQDRERIAHVTIGDTETQASFLNLVNLLGKSASIIYERYSLTPNQEQIFDEIAGRSGQIKESELQAIIKQLGEAK